MVGRVGFPNRAVYATSKWGIVGLTKSLSMELRDDGIRVNCIQPGAVDNARFHGVIKARADASGRTPEAEIDLALASQSVKKLVDMEGIAALARFSAVTWALPSRDRRSRSTAMPKLQPSPCVIPGRVCCD
ncbi:SDR family NAD(P)-dependent oxidoreductase [Cupriavidus lacunae]|uniref:SDR family NAD(P)-dependent oxidoreductase n=1 Tax=Cupriavidus lacunae TaxID=2666307 RepID=A0A370NRW9_9BURK|nr:hypothetical protein DN412_21190 [Cupriavidus lacunae]